MASTDDKLSTQPSKASSSPVTSYRNVQRLQQVIIFIILAIGAVAMIAPFE